jgi:hypothetical protein
MRLLVQQINITGPGIICNDSVSGITGIINCNLTGYNGDFFAQAYLSTTSGWKIIDRISIQINNFYKQTGSEGLFYAILFIIALVLIGIWNPTVSIGFMIAGFILLGITGIIALPWFALISIIILGGYLIYQLRT